MKIWAKTKEFSEGKFLVVRRDGTTPEWPHFVMGARDPAVPPALVRYADQAIACGMDPEFAASVVELAEDFKHFRQNEGDGDPDAAPHRTDLPLAIGMMRHQLEVKDIAATLGKIAELAATEAADALPRIRALANTLLLGRKPARL